MQKKTNKKLNTRYLTIINRILISDKHIFKKKKNQTDYHEPRTRKHQNHQSQFAYRERANCTLHQPRSSHEERSSQTNQRQIRRHRTA